MEKLLRRAALLAVLSALALALPAAALAQTPITIIHVNDTHSHLDSFGPRDAKLQGTIGGLERAAGLIGLLKQTEKNPLFVHAGDAFHGDVFFNALLDVPEFAILKSLNVDAMAVGNHEFDFTPAGLAFTLSNVMPFPIVSANLDFSACPTPDPTDPCFLLSQWIRPGIVKTVGGVPVGIFALTTPSDETMQPAPVVVSADLVRLAQKEIDALRGQGAQVVVLLSHLGRPTDLQLLPAIQGVDVVIGAHDHLLDQTPFWFVAKDGRKVPGVSAGSHYLYVGRLRLTYTPGQGVSVVDWAAVPVDSSVPPYPPIASAVDGAKALIVNRCQEDFWSAAIGYAPFAISRTYDPKHQRRDTAMGNLVTDALRGFTDTDMALSVTGLIGEGLYRGPIVPDDVYRPVSYGYTANTCYGFQVATFKITGAELLKGIETCLYLAAATQSDTYDLQFSGLRYKYDSSKPPFQKVLLDSMHVHGHKLDPGRTYTLTTNAGIPLLLPKMGVQISDVKVIDNAWEYTVLRDYVRRLGFVDYTSESRIRDVAVRPANACHR